MSFHKISASLLASTGLLFGSLPAVAGPFDSVGSGVFAPAATINPGTIGIATPDKVSPATPSQSQNVGNSEVQGLGDHDSWVSQDVLAEDPRALCSDVGLGNNTVATSSQSSSSSSSSNRNSSSSASSGGGGGGVSFLGIGVSGSGESSNRQSNSSASNSSDRESAARTFESSTVAVGRNCDAFVEAAAARDMNYEDNLTERYRISVDRRGEQVDNLLD